MFSDMEHVFCHINNLLIVTYEGFNDHIVKLEEVMTCPRYHNVQVHVKDTFLAAQHFDYLGYYLTPDGIKPQEKKTKAILNIAQPRNIRKLW